MAVRANGAVLGDVLSERSAGSRESTIESSRDGHITSDPANDVTLVGDIL